jgi:hypothetical protein
LLFPCVCVCVCLLFLCCLYYYRLKLTNDPVSRQRVPHRHKTATFRKQPSDRK